MAKQSLKAILKTLVGFVNGFVNDKNNPTGVTAAQINAYTKTEVNNLLSDKLKRDALPIAYWGNSLSFDPGVSAVGGTLKIVNRVPVMMAGYHAVMEPANITIPTASGAYFNIYLKLNAGVFSYETDVSELQESPTVMYLGRATGNGTGSTIIDMTPVIQIAGYRLSNKRRGNAIPISDASGVTQW